MDRMPPEAKHATSVSAGGMNCVSAGGDLSPSFVRERSDSESCLVLLFGAFRRRHLKFYAAMSKERPFPEGRLLNS
jgi:hypothetical protein